MDLKDLFSLITVKHFIERFTNLTYNARFRQKASGKDGNGKPIDFTNDELQEIRKGMQRFAKYILKKTK